MLRIDAIAARYPPDADLGMWIMEFSEKSLDYYWRKSCRLYCEGDLPGVAYIKALQGKYTPTILYYCSSRDEAQIIRYGRYLAKKFEYVNNSATFNFYVMKTDQETVIRLTLKVPTSHAWLRMKSGTGTCEGSGFCG